MLRNYIGPCLHVDGAPSLGAGDLAGAAVKALSTFDKVAGRVSHDAGRHTWAEPVSEPVDGGITSPRLRLGELRRWGWYWHQHGGHMAEPYGRF